MSLQEIQDLKETNSNSVSETLILDENKLVETNNNSETISDFTPTKILEIVSKSYKIFLFRIPDSKYLADKFLHSFS